MGFVPDQVSLTAASGDGPAFLAELYNWINAGNSAHFEIDSNVSGHSSDGFVAIPRDANEDWQLSLRRGQNTSDPLQALIETGKNLTAAGDGSTQPSGITNGQEAPIQYSYTNGTFGGSYDTKFFVSEAKDMLTLFHANANNTLTPAVPHFGRVYNPHYPDFTGKGIITTAPIPETETGPRWLNNSIVEVKKGNWRGVANSFNGGASLVSEFGHPDIYNNGFFPIPEVVVTNSGWVGTARYIHYDPNNDSNDGPFAPGTEFTETFDDTSFVSVGHNGGSGTTSNSYHGAIMPWDDSATPNF